MLVKCQVGDLPSSVKEKSIGHNQVESLMRPKVAIWKRSVKYFIVSSEQGRISTRIIEVYDDETLFTCQVYGTALTIPFTSH